MGVIGGEKSAGNATGAWLAAQTDPYPEYVEHGWCASRVYHELKLATRKKLCLSAIIKVTALEIVTISAELFRREVVDRPTGPNSHGREADFINSGLDNRWRRGDGICSQRDCASLDLELHQCLACSKTKAPHSGPVRGLDSGHGGGGLDLIRRPEAITRRSVRSSVCEGLGCSG